MKNDIQKNTHYMIKNHVSWSGLTLTDAAVQQILHVKNKDPDILGLKVTIKKSGCAGFTYIMSKVVSLNDNNLMFERNGAKLFIPLDVMPFIDGTELDYVEEGLNHMFKFNNPQAQYSCGCGESFGI
ncbi:Fe-S cluster assembly scaffold SufA [Candidatus Blochmannia vicinus]|uniref:Fe-S cluster assembly scaffold SufA n=1 Tax=Candidatus Blochmannia vicinus (nom. nud.) TaxID=251540 RepID=A0A9Q8TYI1_9ENTR|nr:Fe-S cluster assembly scaffold SufA [Candidatus Blochmannia vicinus]URJ28396.1 Fe-S cluster assembly scaffold SufA [Candidatus Blochmannia vicinus]URJ30330.1 Fe-S cluster assembly scaffold SufA [Candidatus Blochmannia vicinus]URJ33027.1 Fe-S cluster assembly scaffold SufA [Candidatus Blochmannia vicinus]